MKDLTASELAYYVIGAASEETAQAVADRCADDPEVAAKLDFLAVLAGDSALMATPVVPMSAAKVAPLRKSERSWLRRAAMFLFVFLIGGGLSWAGWKLIVPQPVFSENFDRNWVDISQWETTRRSVFFADGHARLFDRGCLATQREFSGPFDLRFRWKWIDLSGDILYRDELTVAIHTSGSPGAERPFEIRNGILVKLKATGGHFEIMTGGHPVEGLAVSPKGSYALPADHWFDVRITDDGETVSLFIRPHGRDDLPMDRPVLQAKSSNRGVHHRIAFYNRERVAAASHESWIDDVEIYKLEQR